MSIHHVVITTHVDQICRWRSVGRRLTELVRTHHSDTDSDTVSESGDNRGGEGDYRDNYGQRNEKLLQSHRTSVE